MVTGRKVLFASSKSYAIDTIRGYQEKRPHVLPPVGIEFLIMVIENDFVLVGGDMLTDCDVDWCCCEDDQLTE